MKPTTLLNEHEYFAEITQKVAATRPGDRVALMAMSFAPDEKLTSPLVHELLAAAARGVNVQLNIDAYAFMIDDAKNLPTGPLIRHHDLAKTRRADFRVKLEALENLKAAGGNYCITNPRARRATSPWAGRSHIKFTVINDNLYLGGCNLSKTSVQLDIMVRLEDSHAADWAYAFIMNTARIGNVKSVLDNHDVSILLDDQTKLFIDAGIKKQSLIYEQALKLIDDAREWIVLTCQFFPGSTTAEHLAAATKRGVKVRVYFNSIPGKQGAMTLPHQLAETREKLKHSRSMFSGRLPGHVKFVHAKVLATEQGAMIGSHNYVTQGVRFGTAEDAILRLDPDFARDAVSFVEQMVAVPQLIEAKAPAV